MNYKPMHCGARLIGLIGLLSLGVLSSACDSTSAIATVTARAVGTNAILATMTAANTRPTVAAPVVVATAAAALSTPASAEPSATLTPTDAPTSAPTTAPTGKPTLNLTLVAAITRAASKSATPAVSPTAAPAAKSETDWFNDATAYSLFVRSFRDSNADGIGDLQGVIDGLDYLQSLGVNTLWLLPVFNSPSVHGYDTTDYYTVNPDYGTSDDLLRLINEVHKRGMHILLDYVVNHTSNQHPYFKDAYGNPNSPYSDYYIWRNAAHTEYETFAGVQEMPRLNFDSDKVVQFATDIALHWMDPNKDGDLSDGVDGYRADVASGPYKTFWQHLRAAMNRLNPKAILLGEVWQSTPPDIVPYVSDNRLDAAFDFPLYLQMTGDFNADGDGVFSGKGNPAIAYSIVRSAKDNYPPDSKLARFINNHDTNRIMSDVEGNMDRARAAAVFLLTLPGTPVIYYGEEIGMKGDKCGAPDYDNCRREPLDWYTALQGAGQTSWFQHNNQPNDGISVQEEEAQNDSLLTLYRQFGMLRAQNPAMRSPDYDVLEQSGDQAGLYVLRRWADGMLTIVLINFTNQAIQWKPDQKALTVGADTYTLLPSQPAFAQGITPAADGAAWTLKPGGFAVFDLVQTQAP